MTIYKYLLVDDEPLARNVLKNYLLELPMFEMAGEASNAMEAFAIVQEKKIDLIFLDINMPQVTGLEFIKTLDVKPAIIITTAYREFAVEGFELDVLDYLVKPIELPRFMNALTKFQRKHANDSSLTPRVTASTTEESSTSDHLFVKVDKRFVKIFFNSILFIESLKDYVRIITDADDFITHSNLSQFTNLLPADRFIRIHKSYTVSLDKIKALEGNTIDIGGRSIAIGRNYQQEVKRIILNRE